jgi:acyl carrier protein
VDPEPAHSWQSFVVTVAEFVEPGQSVGGEDTLLVNDLGLDSLAIFELMANLNEIVPVASNSELDANLRSLGELWRWWTGGAPVPID